MPRKSSVNDLFGYSSADDALSAREMAKAEFAKRLYGEIAKRGWTQSEFARFCGLARDAVSTYVRGRSLPSDAALQAMARVLEIPATQLLPISRAPAQVALDEAGYFVELRDLPHDPGFVILKLNKRIPRKLAKQVVKLIQDFEGD